MIHPKMPTQALKDRWTVGRTLLIVGLLSVRKCAGVQRTGNKASKANKANKANKAQHSRKSGPIDTNTF